MAVSNQYMEAAANTIFELSSDEFVREQCRARDEYNAYVKLQQQIIAEKDKALTDAQEQLSDTQEQLSDTQEQLSDSQALNAKQAAEIARLKEELRKAKGE